MIWSLKSGASIQCWIRWPITEISGTFKVIVGIYWIGRSAVVAVKRRRWYPNFVLILNKKENDLLIDFVHIFPISWPLLHYCSLQHHHPHHHCIHRWKVLSAIFCGSDPLTSIWVPATIQEMSHQNYLIQMVEINSFFQKKHDFFVWYLQSC